MSFQSFDQSSVQSMNRCTGPDPCTCPITGPHQPDNAECTRNRRARNRAAFDAKVRTVGYVDRVTGRRIYDPDALGVPACPKGKGECASVTPDKRCFGCPRGVAPAAPVAYGTIAERAAAGKDAGWWDTPGVSIPNPKPNS